MYGYRTPSSMKNQATWDEANKFCANIFFNFSVSASFLFFLIGLFFQNYLKSLFKDITIFNVTCLLITLIPMVLIVIVGTESHLKKIFDSQGNKKNTENQ